MLGERDTKGLLGEPNCRPVWREFRGNVNLELVVGLEHVGKVDAKAGGSRHAPNKNLLLF